MYKQELDLKVWIFSPASSSVLLTSIVRLGNSVHKSRNVMSNLCPYDLSLMLSLCTCRPYIHRSIQGAHAPMYVLSCHLVGCVVVCKLISKGGCLVLTNEHSQNSSFRQLSSHCCVVECHFIQQDKGGRQGMLD